MSAWGIPFAGASSADAAIATEALTFDPRSAGNSKHMVWIRLESQPVTQLMPASKAHLPHCVVTIPTPLPSSMNEFLALRTSLGNSPEAAVALFQVAMVIYGSIDTELGARCFVCCADVKQHLQVRGCSLTRRVLCCFAVDHCGDVRHSVTCTVWTLLLDRPRLATPPPPPPPF